LATVTQKPGFFACNLFVDILHGCPEVGLEAENNAYYL
jgi:hypothetical protein